jgi:hypothetical protein
VAIAFRVFRFNTGTTESFAMRESVLRIFVFILLVSQVRAQFTVVPPPSDEPPPPPPLACDSPNSWQATRSTDCACGKGFTGYVAESIQCGGTCGCPGSLESGGIITDGDGYYANNEECWWIIRGTRPSVSFTYFNTEYYYDYVWVEKCQTESCAWGGVDPIYIMSGQPTVPLTVTNTQTQFMRVRFTSSARNVAAGFEATWSKGGLTGCSACAVNTYKATNGSDACLACPSLSTSTAGSRACACDRGYTEDVVTPPGVTCGGTCGCPSSLTWGGVITDGEGQYSTDEDCWWIISGRNPSVTFTSYDTNLENDYVYIEECTERTCSSGVVQQGMLEGYIGPPYSQLPSFTTTKPFMRVRFKSVEGGGPKGYGFTAHWSAELCRACSAGTYKSSVGLEMCTACPLHTSSAVSSDDEMDCICESGYTGGGGSTCRHVRRGRTRPPRDLNHALLARWVRHLSQAVPDQRTVRVTLGTPLLLTEDVLLVPVALTKTTSDLDPALIVEPILTLTQRVRRLPILALHARPILCLYQEV